ncbi:hypothetical protein [Micromonospora peucetia]|nr:hypothetical protein [Micromonospora peucetia]
MRGVASETDPPSSTYSRVWDEARTEPDPGPAGLTLAGRPSDLRHAGVSLWLNAGHPVDVLLKVYAKCLDGDRSRMNERIEAALSR